MEDGGAFSGAKNSGVVHRSTLRLPSCLVKNFPSGDTSARFDGRTQASRRKGKAKQPRGAAGSSRKKGEWRWIAWVDRREGGLQAIACEMPIRDAFLTRSTSTECQPDVNQMQRDKHPTETRARLTAFSRLVLIAPAKNESRKKRTQKLQRHFAKPAGVAIAIHVLSSPLPSVCHPVSELVEMSCRCLCACVRCLFLPDIADPPEVWPSKIRVGMFAKRAGRKPRKLRTCLPHADAALSLARSC